MQGPQARSREPSWLSRFPISKSLEHFLSSPSLQPNSLPPLPTCSNIPTGKAQFQQHTRPTHCFYQGCLLPPHQDHQDPTGASPSLILIQRATPRIHLLACLSSLCKIFWGGPAQGPPNCKYKIILSPLQELFLTFPSLLKLLSLFTFLSHIQNTVLKKSFNASNKHIFYSLGT